MHELIKLYRGGMSGAGLDYGVRMNAFSFEKLEIGNGFVPDQFGGQIALRAITYISGLMDLGKQRSNPGSIHGNFGMLVLHEGIETEFLFPYPLEGDKPKKLVRNKAAAFRDNLLECAGKAQTTI